MVQLHDIIPKRELEEAIDAGLVARKTSPDGSRFLFVYTPMAQYKNAWNVATMNARGLVVDAVTLEVLARPLKKFMNYGDPTLGDLDLDAPVEATDKMDGSLAILQPDETLVSKGSFTSHIAEHATRLYTERYLGKWDRRPEVTYLFEDIFPAGRIVLDYAGLEDLVLLGGVVTETGELLGPLDLPEWPGPRTEVLPAGTLREALALPARENAEGMVLRFLDGSGLQVKLKQDDYKALHAVVTNTSTRTLWEAVAVRDLLDTGATPKELVRLLRLGPDRIERVESLGDDWEVKLSDNVPDEFHTWMQDTIRKLRTQFTDLEAYTLREAANAAALELPRKELVTYLRDADLHVTWNHVLATVLHGQGELPAPVRAALWRQIYPEADRLGWVPPTE